MFVYTNDPNSRTFRQDTSVYPHEDSSTFVIQIDEDRYSGHYSGHSFTAWLGIRPSWIDEHRNHLEEYWVKWKNTALYGGGQTPQEAFKDLLAKVEASDLHLVDKEKVIRDDLLVVTLHMSGKHMEAMLYDSDLFRSWLNESESLVDMQLYSCLPYTVKTTGTSFIISALSDEDAIIKAKERAREERIQWDRVVITNDRDVEVADVPINR